jgi:hypothetical protein
MALRFIAKTRRSRKSIKGGSSKCNEGDGVDDGEPERGKRVEKRRHEGGKEDSTRKAKIAVIIQTMWTSRMMRTKSHGLQSG